MNKVLFLMLMNLLIINPCFAVQGTDKIFPPNNWISRNATDFVTIQNGTGISIVIVIIVDNGSGGINIKNCGTTTHVNAGSSAICATNDAVNPVTLNSDSSNMPVTGTYQIKQL